MHKSASPPKELPVLLTVQGQARSGKGTLAGALKRDLAVDHRTHLIDQGLKFRVIAERYLADGGDIEDIDAIGAFLGADGYNVVLQRLGDVAKMEKPEIETIFYTSQINNASGMVGKSAIAQAKAIDLLVDEVKQAAQEYEMIILDGRAMLEKGRKLETMGVIRYPLALDVKCSSLVAAQRLTGLFKPVEELSPDEAHRLLTQVSDIEKRNSADARRKVFPSLPISGAYEFDVTHPHNDDELIEACTEAQKAGAVSLDNSYTRAKDEFTQPAIKLVRAVLTKLT